MGRPNDCKKQSLSCKREGATARSCQSMLEVKFGTPKNLEEMSFRGRLRQLHLRGVGEGPVVVSSPVGWVAAGGVLSLGLESLGITLTASPIHHART